MGPNAAMRMFRRQGAETFRENGYQTMAVGKILMYHRETDRV